MTQKRYQKVMNIKDLLNTSSFAKLMKKGLFINELNHKLDKLFPVQCKGLYRIANCTENSLNIEVTNAMVRQNLLFCQHELLQIVQQDMPEITQLKFSINPELNKTN
ncbi:DUF721 domain-containing protein [Lonepinella koalarum]|uniref:Uncharacterized protein DUF721 n=1 Tax=Lonepinella koalarum TaxID=53417 RepID=A0A4R1KWC6_9PAST|nr:DciA family protein [Lonepinella koalarum]MDH2926539.1 hypothetical protein [Lonepinella koalarum]TCK69525.1 uncharacterized protein DUF721 [Lonepinella koalarum]TFJ89770.1 DUF721 domain-containing protein [Lonepinella koalarum]TYG34042.1 DUF721 domain-containing protein [Lonepinella koalarum]